MPDPFSSGWIWGGISCLGKVRPYLEHNIAGGLVLGSEYTFHGNYVTLEQHEDFVGMGHSNLSGKKVQSNELTKILQNKLATFL